MSATEHKNHGFGSRRSRCGGCGPSKIAQKLWLEGLEDNQYATYSTQGTSKDNTRIWQAYYQHLFHLTYHRQFNEHLKLDIGYELDALQTDLNFHVQNLEGDVFVPDRNRTNDFTNDETNHALYATAEYKQGAWGLLFGLRPELMLIRSHLHSPDSIVTNDYWMVCPTLHVAYAIDERNELRLNYSLRVNRPEADDLNPFPEYQNPVEPAGGQPVPEARKRWGRMLASDAFSALLMGSVACSLKQTTHVMRPDGSNNKSFPSGHTATAFMTATMLTKEYGHKSPWIGIGAYSAATVTGLMRMANNKHWLSDVLTGAGIGILSTELGYYLADLIFKEKGIRRFTDNEASGHLDKPSFFQPLCRDECAAGRI